MNLDRPPNRYYRKAPVERRIYSFVIDFVIIWLSSSFWGDWLLRSVIFLALWWILRVIIPENNQGQSLGHWSMDIKVIDPRYNRTPSILDLSKREGVIGLSAVLAMWGLEIGLTNGLSMILLLSPLLTDGGVALSDPELYQAVHDRIAKTIAISSKRGFSLDLRVKKLLVTVTRRFRSKR